MASRNEALERTGIFSMNLAAEKDTPQTIATSAVLPGNTIVLPGQTPDGQHILSVLLKRTYSFAKQNLCVRAEKDRKIISGDQHYDGPMNSSVRFESDFAPYKLATDIVLNGNAYAPDGQSVQELTATLMVGEHRKDIYVVGDRMALYKPDTDPVFTDPQPFKSMEIRYERAYGGVDIYSDRKLHCIYGRNHLGRGFAISNTKDVVDKLLLPNIEDSTDRITPERLCIGKVLNWEQQPMPQGFGWFAKHWRPRSLMAGVLPADKKFEEEMRAIYKTLIPADQLALYEQTRLPNMDFRFFNGASQGMALPFLTGDEVIRARNLSPKGDVTFQLPGDRPLIGLDIGSGVQEPLTVLHTVMIHMNEQEVDLVWRGAVPYAGPDWLPEMRKMEVLIK